MRSKVYKEEKKVEGVVERIDRKMRTRRKEEEAKSRTCRLLLPL